MLDGSEAVVGEGEPQATFVVCTRRGLDALSTFDVVRVGEAYLDGHLDAEGDLSQLLALRAILTDRHPVQYAGKFVRPLLRGQVRSDPEYIEHHYENDPDFFLSFLDRRHRAYSQGVFEHPDEPLEDGITRKLDYALDAIGVGPGARVLDIGGGWGAFIEYGGQRGCTSLADDLGGVAAVRAGDHRRPGLPCEVRREHFFGPSAGPPLRRHRQPRGHRAPAGLRAHAGGVPDAAAARRPGLPRRQRGPPPNRVTTF